MAGEDHYSSAKLFDHLAPILSVVALEELVDFLQYYDDQIALQYDLVPERSHLSVAVFLKQIATSI